MGPNLFGGTKGKRAVFGTKPVYQTPEEAAAQALKANEANLPASEALGTKVDQYNLDRALAMMEKVAPGFAERQAKIGSILEDQLGGKVPEDVVKQLQMFSASSGQRGGALFAGSEAMGAAELNRFGKTSYDITNNAIATHDQWSRDMNALLTPQKFNVTSAFISPQEQYAHNKLVSDVKASPDPGERGIFDSTMAVRGMVLGAYAGGAGYQGTYRKPDSPNSGQLIIPAGNSGGGSSPYYLNNATEGGGQWGVPSKSWSPGTGGGLASEGGNFGQGGAAWGGAYGETAGAGAFAF